MLISKTTGVKELEEGKRELTTIFVEEFSEEEYKQRQAKLIESKAQLEGQANMIKARIKEIGPARFVSDKTKDSLKTAMEMIELDKLKKRLIETEKEAAVYSKDIESLK